MRSELEGRLVFAAPSELLIATPLSSYSERLLVGPCAAACMHRYPLHPTEPQPGSHVPRCVCQTPMQVSDLPATVSVQWQGAL